KGGRHPSGSAAALVPRVVSLAPAVAYEALALGCAVVGAWPFMQSRWSEADARKTVDVWGALGVGEALALRIYTTRLLGGDPALVLHGGGNTSLKTEMRDLLGETHWVLRVKGSGRDMATIDASGLPAVKLEPLRKLRLRDGLSDEDMLYVQRAYLLDPT